MNYLVSQIVNFITEQDVISDESDVQDFYRYGIEISISSLLNIVLVVIAGILIHHIIESIVFLSLFILIRSVTQIKTIIINRENLLENILLAKAVNMNVVHINRLHLKYVSA